MKSLAVVMVLFGIVASSNSYSMYRRETDNESVQDIDSISSRVSDTELNRVKRSDTTQEQMDMAVFLVCTITEACVKNKQGKYIHPQCGKHPTVNFRRACFLCRNVRKVCPMMRFVHTIFG